MKKLSKQKPKTLIIACTHGNEGFSIPIIKELAKNFAFDWIIGNLRAKTKNLRYLEADLNRSAPGNLLSEIYEERRARQIINLAKSYDRIIDIHGTVSNTGLFVIVSDPSWENIELARTIPLKNVVLWPGLKSSGPITQFARPGIEIECGPKDSPNSAIKLRRVLTEYFEGSKPTLKQKFFIVTGKIRGRKGKQLSDFNLVKLRGRQFYPLLSNNQYPGIICYTMQRLNDTL